MPSFRARTCRPGRNTEQRGPAFRQPHSAQRRIGQRLSYPRAVISWILAQEQRLTRTRWAKVIARSLVISWTRSMAAALMKLFLAPRHDIHGPIVQVYARARLQHVCITERYACRQEISRNPSKATLDERTGEIELTIPFDGYDYLTRQAHADVSYAAVNRPAGAASEPVIGHLVLSSYENTDLDSRLSLNETHGAIPVRIPLNTGAGGQEHLIADRQACVISYDYKPSPAKVVPVDIDIEPMDPDSLEPFEPDSFSLPAVEPLTSEWNSRVLDLAPRLAQQVSFKSSLSFRITVTLDIPRRSAKVRPLPKITRMALDWPTVTSLDALTLRVGDEIVPLRYNPVDQIIEWSDIPMYPTSSWDSDNDGERDDDGNGDGDIRSYRSRTMYLSISQPGELYRQKSLKGEAEIEISDYLISGMDTRLFNAVGSTETVTSPELTCRVSSQLALILDDAFARRKFFPYQHLYFDEVIPEAARITDIMTALEDRGFTVRNLPLPGDGNDQFLTARRREGPDDMDMLLLIQPRHYQTERENRVPGGHTYKSTFDSGELKIFMRGELPRDSSELTHEMNALQRALRERFDRVRARR
jgi:hypothetical protein